MSQDIFVNLTGIAGESQDVIHVNEIEVLTWDWSVNQPSNMHSGSSGGAEKSTVHDLTFEHYVDRASPNLIQYCLTGQHISDVTLVMRQAGGQPLEYLTIRMEDVLVTLVRVVGSNNMLCPI